MVAVLVVALAWAGLGCATGGDSVRAVSTFTEEDAEIFDDGIDFVADPAGLEGPWQEGWREDLERRVTNADLIATVTVQTIRTDIDLERQETVRLVTDLNRALLGEAPEDELILTVREGQPGFSSVEGNDRRILNQPFVAFIKWYRSEQGEVRPHWHLAPATQGVVRQTRDLIERQRTGPDREPRRRKVIIHEG